MKRLILLFVFLTFYAGKTVSAQTVYATKSGTKYHTKDCRYAQQSGYPLSMDEAKAKGLSPCGVCHPDAHQASPDSNPGSSLQQQTSAGDSEIKVYITKSGTKYHRATCRYAKTGWEVPISEAKAKGLGPCSVCKPDY